jgi:twitching motility protein PilJ
LVFIFLEIYRRSSEKSDTDSHNQQAILLLLDETSSLKNPSLKNSLDEAKNFSGTIPEAINFVIGRLGAFSKRIQDSSENLSATANETRVVASQLAEVSEHQLDEIGSASMAVKELEKAIEELSAKLTNIAVETEKISSLAKKSTVVIKNTALGMNDTQNKMNETSKYVNKLSENFKGIETVVSALNDMAGQAHILGLNAAIQASTAGDAGKGFGVIAEEVQRLAERSGVAIKQITSLISTIHIGTDNVVGSIDEAVCTVTKGKEVSGEAGCVVIEIEAASLGLTGQINDAASALGAQVASTIKVSKTIDVIQDISSQLLVGTNNTAEIMNELAELSSVLSDTVCELKKTSSDEILCLDSLSDFSVTESQGNS